MKVWELLMKIIIESKDLSFLEVKVDGSIPKPLEDLFSIKYDKGHLLFIPKDK